MEAAELRARVAASLRLGLALGLEPNLLAAGLRASQAPAPTSPKGPKPPGRGGRGAQALMKGLRNGEVAKIVDQMEDEQATPEQVDAASGSGHTHQQPRCAAPGAAEEPSSSAPSAGAAYPQAPSCPRTESRKVTFEGLGVQAERKASKSLRKGTSVLSRENLPPDDEDSDDVDGHAESRVARTPTAFVRPRDLQKLPDKDPGSPGTGESPLPAFNSPWKLPSTAEQEASQLRSKLCRGFCAGKASGRLHALLTEVFGLPGGAGPSLGLAELELAKLKARRNLTDGLLTKAWSPSDGAPLEENPAESLAAKDTSLHLAHAISERDRRIGELEALVRQTEMRVQDRDSVCGQLELSLKSARLELAHVQLDLEHSRKLAEDLASKKLAEDLTNYGLPAGARAASAATKVGGSRLHSARDPQDAAPA